MSTSSDKTAVAELPRPASKLNPFSFLIPHGFLAQARNTLAEAQAATDVGEKLLKYNQAMAATHKKLRNLQGDSFLMTLGLGALGAFGLSAIGVTGLPLGAAVFAGLAAVKYWQHASNNVNSLVEIHETARRQVADLSAPEKTDDLARSRELPQVMRSFPQIRERLEEKFLIASIREQVRQQPATISVQAPRIQTPAAPN